MAERIKKRKRSSEIFEGKAVIKRQVSARTLVATQLESSLHLGTSSPRVMPDQVPSLSRKFDGAKTEDSDDSCHLDRDRVSKKDSSTKESKPDIESECGDVENTVLSFSPEPVVDVPVIPVNTQTTEAEEGVEKESCDEPDGLFSRKIAHKVNEVIDCVMPHHHHHHDDIDDKLEGFSVHLPAHFHQFDSPCPFGARLNKSENGYKLTRVLIDTVAYKAGLRESDTLTHLNDTELQTLDISDIQKLFMHIETTFTLTILRKHGEGDEVDLEKKTIRVTSIADEVVVDVVHTEIIWSRRPYHIGTSKLSFVSQDEPDVSQIYLDATGEKVTMGNYTDERAQFYLDFYAVIGLPQGQRCTIRHANNDTLYDAEQNKMKPMRDPFNPNQACMLDKIPRSNGTFVFESVDRRGQYLIYEKAAGTLKLSKYESPISVPSTGSFHVIKVNNSAQ